MATTAGGRSARTTTAGWLLGCFAGAIGAGVMAVFGLLIVSPLFDTEPVGQATALIFIASTALVLTLVPTMAWRSQHQAGFAALAP